MAHDSTKLCDFTNTNNNDFLSTPIALDVDALKLRSIPPKHDINESLKYMIISLMSAKKEPLGCVLKKIAL